MHLRFAQSGTAGSLRYCSLPKDLVTTTSVAPKMAAPEKFYVQIPFSCRICMIRIVT